VRRSTVRRVAVSAAAIVAAAGVVVVWAATASSRPTPARLDPDSGSTSSRIQPAPAPGEEYWTPERMRSAQPAPMPPDDE
jgi:hypothetical protein